MKEPVIDALEKKSAELTKGDKEEERPDVNDVEDKTSKEEDGEVLDDENSVHDHLAFVGAVLDFVLLDLLFLGGKGEDKVVHIHVADAVQEALENGQALRLYLHQSLFILCLKVEASHGKNVEEDKDESRPEVAIAPGVGEEDEGNQPRRDLEDVGEEQD